MKINVTFNLGVIFLVLFVLKLCGVLTCSWWWVTAPLWFPFAFVGGIVLILMACAFVLESLS